MASFEPSLGEPADASSASCAIPSSSSSCRTTNISSTPEDALLNIFQFCDPRTLLIIEIVSLHWRELCHSYDRELWSRHCIAAWGKNLNKPSSVNVKDRIKELPLSKLKKSLRAIDLTRCVEKTDFQNMLLAKLIFGRVMERELHGDDVRFRGKYMTMYYPEWSLHMGIMKASYIHARLQQERTHLFPSELCLISWIFRFKENAFEDMQGQSPTWKTKFSEDGSMYSEMNDHNYQWKVSCFPCIISSS